MNTVAPLANRVELIIIPIPCIERVEFCWISYTMASCLVLTVPPPVTTATTPRKSKILLAASPVSIACAMLVDARDHSLRRESLGARRAVTLCHRVAIVGNSKESSVGRGSVAGK